MLDLNFVRENLEEVKKGLATRNFPANALDRFVELDTERRRVISEADSINQQRNARVRGVAGASIAIASAQNAKPVACTVLMNVGSFD